MRRAFVAAGLVLAMLAFGVGVYQAAGFLKAGRAHVQRPSQTRGPSLPGTVYVVQAGAIYRYQQGAFAQVTSEAGWTQPAADPTGSHLVAVRRQSNFSDLFLLERSGRIDAQLTHNRTAAVEADHWSFYPRFSPDGSHLFYAYDPKDPYNSFRVDLAILASPADPAATTAVRWTYPNEYTGGDVGPVPLRGGGLIYTKFSIDDQSNVHAQIWYQSRPGSPGAALTDPAADCLQPALSADEHHLAMVCTNGRAAAPDLVEATFDPATPRLGTQNILVKGQMVASPSFSPDGGSVAYLGPASAGGGFQLWTLSVAQSTATPPRQIGSGLDLDATSAPIWLS